MSVEANVNKWIQYDDKIKEYNTALKSLRENRQVIELNLKEQSPSGAALGNQIKIAQLTTTPPLTFKYIEHCLNEIVTDPTQVKIIVDYIKGQREKRSTTYIRRITI